MQGKMEQAVQGVLAKTNFAIVDEARSHDIDLQELRLALIERLFNATEEDLREMLHAATGRQEATA